MTPAKIFAVRLARARIDEVRTVAALVEDVGFGTSEVASVAASQFVGVRIVGRQRDVATTEVLRVGDAAAIFLAAGIERNRDVEVDRQAVFAIASEDVHHARDRVRTVDRRCAGLQDLDVIDDRQRQDVEVEGRNRTARTCRAGATAVEQDQRTVRAEAAKVDGLGAGAAVGDEVRRQGRSDLGRTRSDRRALQGAGEVELAFLASDFRADDRNRVRAVELVHRGDARTGHDDCRRKLFFRGVDGYRLFLLGVLRRGAGGKCDGGKARPGAQDGTARKCVTRFGLEHQTPRVGTLLDANGVLHPPARCKARADYSPVMGL